MIAKKRVSFMLATIVIGSGTYVQGVVISCDKLGNVTIKLGEMLFTGRAISRVRTNLFPSCGVIHGSKTSG